MANLETHPPVRTDVVEPQREKKVEIKRKTSIGGVAVETLGAVTALVLSIIGLAGLFPLDLAAISAIAAGVALLFEGLSVAAQLRPASAELVPREATTGEIGVEALAGLGGIVLGILALAHIDAPALLPISALVLGTGLLFAVHPLTEVTNENVYYDRSDTKQEVIHGAATAASGAHALAGLAAIVLGIIGLVTNTPSLAYSLVAFLVLGATVLLGSAAVGGKLAGYFQRGV
jgi:hypothetical protein